jgi:hypothetical protein
VRVLERGESGAAYTIGARQPRSNLDVVYANCAELGSPPAGHRGTDRQYRACREPGLAARLPEARPDRLSIWEMSVEKADELAGSGCHYMLGR